MKASNKFNFRLRADAKQKLEVLATKYDRSLGYTLNRLIEFAHAATVELMPIEDAIRVLTEPRVEEKKSA